MQSSNPILKRTQEFTEVGGVATLEGTIKKSTILALVACGVGLVVFLTSLLMGLGALALGATAVGSLSVLLIGIVVAFKPQYAKEWAYPFAISEGLFLGGISAFFQTKYPGVPIMALIATFATCFIMYALYAKRIIVATAKFKAVVLSASLVILVVFIVQILMSLIFGSSIPLLFENGILGVGFAVFVAVIASLNLILDFDLIEQSIQRSAPKYMEYVSAIALLGTLVWMYYSFLRLIGLLSNDD